ncbi:NADH dehydrogenase -like protein [Apiospora arundinis]
MRYEDWDLLIFPQDSKIPLQEFKTQCHVVHDPEFAFTSGSYGLPTPNLLRTWPHRRHSFQHIPPQLAKARNQSIHEKLQPASGHRQMGGPCDHRWTASCTVPEFTKNGELLPLKFPHFREELLQQNYWSPSDELGRIKIILSEGFPRDSLTVPVERVKNLITFSFQHAPMDILESSGIAWPNPRMWYRSPIQNQSMPVPTQAHTGGSEAHIHSPRRGSEHGICKSISSTHDAGLAGWSAAQTSSFLGNMPHTQSLLQRGSKGGINNNYNTIDAFYRPYSDSSTHLSDWNFPNTGPMGLSPSTQQSKLFSQQTAGQKASRKARKLTSSDLSMPDYISNPGSISQHMAELQQTGSHAHNPIGNIVNGDVENAFHHPKVSSRTANSLPGQSLVEDLIAGVSNKCTPGRTSSTNDLFVNSTKTCGFPSELATSLTQSLLSQPSPLPAQAGTTMTAPAAEVKSRKENRLGVNRPALLDHLDMRKVSQAAFGDSSENFTQNQNFENGENSSREASSGVSPQASSRTFSGVFSHCSGSGGDLAKKLNSTNNFDNANLDVSTPARMGDIGDVHLSGSGRGGQAKQTPDPDRTQR